MSRLLVPNSVPARALELAMDSGELLMSTETLEELSTVVWRPKFDSYLTNDDREKFFNLLSSVVNRVDVLHQISICRDSKDDKFLSLALCGEADGIISGDRDLLDLHPFEGIPIYTPQQFLHTQQDG